MPTSVQEGVSFTPPKSHFYHSLCCPVNGLSVRLDYLTCLGFVEDIQSLISFLTSLTEPIVVEEHNSFCGRYYFTHRGSSPNGVYVDWLVDDSLCTYRLTVPGKVFAYLPLIDQYHLVEVLCSVYRARCTRIDIALDLWNSVITPELLLQCYERGEYAGFQKEPKIYSTYEKTDNSVFPGQIITGIGLGRRSGGKTLVVYRTRFVHDFDTVRLELRFFEDRADKTFNLFAILDPNLYVSSDEFEGEIGKFLASFIPGEYRFGVRKDKNLDRMVLKHWWKGLIMQIGKTRITHLPAPQPSLQKSMSWFERQVAKKLYCIREALGVEDFEMFMTRAFERARMRLKPHDFALIEMGKNMNFQIDEFEFFEVER